MVEKMVINSCEGCEQNRFVAHDNPKHFSYVFENVYMLFLHRGTPLLNTVISTPYRLQYHPYMIFLASHIVLIAHLYVHLKFQQDSFLQ